MAQSTPIEQRDPGEPIARDAIDPEMIKLARSRPKIGAITAAGLVFLSIMFVIRLGADRRFAGNTALAKVEVSEIVAGHIATERYVSVKAEPLMSHAIRATPSKGSLGMRVVPMRGTGDLLWLVTSGDGWEAPALGGYEGRLRRLTDLPFAGAITAYAAAHPRPVFATAAAIRSGFAASQITTVAGDTVTVAPTDVVAFDVIDPKAATVIATFTAATKDHDPLPDPASWSAQLKAAGITPISTGTTDSQLGQVRFEVAMPPAEITSKLEAANLWAARVEPVSRHYETTWSTLQARTTEGLRIRDDLRRLRPEDPEQFADQFFVVGTATIPDANLDVVGVYASKSIPSGAYALITGERPADYWYVVPITIALGVIGLVFAWALIRAIRRDLLPPAHSA